jgi:hypothetical protein
MEVVVSCRPVCQEVVCRPEVFPLEERVAQEEDDAAIGLGMPVPNKDNTYKSEGRVHRSVVFQLVLRNFR